MISSGATEVVYPGGTDQGATVNGTQLIWGSADCQRRACGQRRLARGCRLSLRHRAVELAPWRSCTPAVADQAATVIGTQQVWAGGVASGAHINSGGLQQILGSASGSVVSSGATEVVYSGGTDQAATISGTQVVWGGAVASGAHVGSGGLQEVLGLASATQLNSGGLDFVGSGGVVSGATISGGRVEIAAAARRAAAR